MTFWCLQILPKNEQKQVDLRYHKGQLISKGLFGILNSSKNEQKKFALTTMIPQADLFLFVFWKNLKTPKRNFEIN